MSDPVSNLEIEDVLSSIRRLVTEEARSAPRRKEKDSTSKPGNDRLVLTPSQRVPEGKDGLAVEERAQPADKPSIKEAGEAREIKPFALTARYSSVEYADEIEFRRSARRVLRRPPRAAAAVVASEMANEKKAAGPAATTDQTSASGDTDVHGTSGVQAGNSGQTGKRVEGQPWRNPEATLHDAAAAAGLTEQEALAEDADAQPSAEPARDETDPVAETVEDQMLDQVLTETVGDDAGQEDALAMPEVRDDPDAAEVAEVEDSEDQETESMAASGEPVELPDDGAKQEERAAVEFRETGRFEQAVRAEARRSQALSASDTLSAKIQALEAAIARKQEQWEPDGDVGDDYAGVPVNTIPWKDRVAEVRKAAAEARDTGSDRRAEPVFQLGKSAMTKSERSGEAGKLVISEDEAREAVAESIAQVAELAKAHAEAAVEAELNDMVSEADDLPIDESEILLSADRVDDTLPLTATEMPADELAGAEVEAKVSSAPDVTTEEELADVIAAEAEVEAVVAETRIAQPEEAAAEAMTAEGAEKEPQTEPARAPLVLGPEFAGTEKAAAHVAEETAVADEADMEEPVVTRATPSNLEEAPVDLTADETVLDEDTLRELVADIVRQELQGALGERITRNVRKLVRREIHRALTAQNLE